MTRDECWMTFSEALELYLQSRETARCWPPGRNKDDRLFDMKVAAEHMDALTQPDYYTPKDH